MVVLTAKVRAPQPRGLQRQRLLSKLQPLKNWRVAIISAPAGSGKTTLAAQHAADTNAATAWLRVEPTEAAPTAFLEHLGRSLSDATGISLPGQDGLDGVIDGLDSTLTSDALLVIDDAHVLCGAPAESMLERFVRLSPPLLHIVVAGRRVPDINLPRLRLDEDLLEIDGEDLRFRAWEAERLLREIYEAPLPPEDVARLVRRMEGWAAGLQLFHLATRGQPSQARRSELHRLVRSSRLTQSYLVSNVLAGLPADVTYFLTRTSVLDVLSGRLCDSLLATSGSQQVLEKLARAQMFTQPAEDGSTFSYHQVMRDYLEMSLLDEIGEPAVVEWRRHAATALEAGGHIAEAVGTLARIGAWEEVTRLLHEHGPQLAGQPATWTDIVPPELRENDPWLTLAEARRTLASGTIAEAHRHYRRSGELGLGFLGFADLGREIAEAFAPDSLPGPATWARRLRAATRSCAAIPHLDLDPSRDGPEDYLSNGLIALLAGDIATATDSLRYIGESTSPPAMAITARLGELVAAWMSDPPAAESLERRALDAYVEGAFWIARLASILAAVRQLDRDAIAMRRAHCVADQDRWGTGLADLACAITCIQLGDWSRAQAEATRAAEIFDALQAPVLSTWSRAVALHAEPDRARQHGSAAELERRARTLGVPGARALALAAASPQDRRHAEVVARECGLDFLARLPAQSASTDPRPERAHEPARVRQSAVADAAVVVVRCFGAFRLEADGAEVSLTSLRPKARALLHFLCISAGKPIHREVLLDRLWPEQSTDAGLHGLHVAVSALRRTLEPDAKRGESQLIVRAGSSYSFALAPGSSVDVLEFDAAISAGNAARRRGDTADAQGLLSRALSLYADDLLPEDGPADWVIEPREHRRHAAADAAAAVAELSMASQDLAAAIDAAMSAVRLDPLSDSGWRHLTEAHRRAGDLAAAAQASRQHRQVLVELGIPVPEQRPGIRR